MRVVLDTNVVASAILWGGKPRLLLHAAHAKRIKLFTSTAMLAELTDILGRRKFDKKIAASRSLSGLWMGPRWIGKGVEARRKAQPCLSTRRVFATPHPPPFRSNPEGRGNSGRQMSLPARCVVQPHGLADA